MNNLLNKIFRIHKQAITAPPSQYFVDNCGKDGFGTVAQLECSIPKNNHLFKMNDALLTRLSKSWTAMVEDSTNLPPEYRIAGEWKAIIDDNFNPLMTALENNDLITLETLLSNLFRNYGDFFGEPTSYEDALYKKNKTERFKLYTSRWFDLYGEEELDELVDPQIGNPVGYVIDEQFYTQGQFVNNFFARRIKDLTSDRQSPVICEIGGGFGGIAYQLIKKIPNLRYIDFDIPIIGILSAYYLLTAFPEVKIGLYGEIEDLATPFREHDILILPNFAIRSVNANIADLCFNKCSFSEMDRQTVVEYFGQFDRICSGYVLHMNHSWEQTVHDGFKHWNLSEVEPSSSTFKRLHKIPAPFQSDFHGEFFEWLYEKKTPR